MKRIVFGLMALFMAGAAPAEPIRIAHVYDKTGALAEYGRQLQLGLELGFEYATAGTRRVLERPLQLIEKDSQLSPARARGLLAEAYADDEAVVAIAAMASPAVLGAMGVAADYRRILIVESASDAVTGTAWNRYVFRVARSWSQDVIANALVVARPGVCIATIAQDQDFARNGVAVYRKAANKLGAIVFQEEYLASAGAHAGPAMQRLIDSLADRGACRDKYIAAIWAAGPHPFAELADAQLELGDIKLALGGNVAQAAERRLPAVEGAVDYHFQSPVNAANDWLVMEHFRRFNSPPGPYVAQGMAQAMFVVAAIEEAGSTETEDLIEAMEGLSFEGPKGRMIMRPEDHQALQSMYHMRMDAGEDGAQAMKLVREIKAREIELPIYNRP